MGNRIFSTGTLSAVVPNPAAVPGGMGTPTSLLVAGGVITGDNRTYTATGAMINGQAVYQGYDGGNYIAYQGGGVWILFDNNDPLYSGGSAAGPLSTNGAWVTHVGGSAPTVTAAATEGSGVAATLTIPLLNLQSITFELLAQVKDLWQPVQVSAFPDKRAYYGIHLTGKAKIATVSASALQILAGLSFAGGTPNVGTVSTIVSLPPFAGVFSTVDANGVPIVVSAPNVTCPGVSLPFQLSDFAMPDFSFDALPDPTSKIVATTQIG